MINWSDIDLKGRNSGTVKTTCPNCSHERKKKTDPCLSVNIDKGAAKCHNCEEVSWREQIERKPKEYNTPPPQWTNHTALSEGAVKWFAKRGITQKTLVACKITEERHYQPAAQKEMNNIVFNYFEGKTLVNKKYRSASKQFTQTKGAKKIFYGINDIVDSDEVIIVEGEMDKLAMFEAGHENCISVPNGANDLNDVFENCEEYLKGVKCFLIAVDMDEAGTKLEEALVKRLGKHRCKRVKFEGKDANEDLVSGNLESALKRPFLYPVEGTYTAADCADAIFDLHENGFESPIRPKNTHLRNFSQGFAYLPGQLTVITGIPSHGKSNFTEWWMLNLSIDLNVKVSFYSPEHLPMQLHHAQLAEKVIGKPFYGECDGQPKMSKLELQKYNEWSSERVYLTAPDKGKIADWDWLFERFEEQIFRFGIDVFVVDAFNKVKRNNPDSLGELGEILARVTNFCQQHNTNIKLIAHPTKMKKREDGKYERPTLYDVKGTGDFYDQTHNGGCIYTDYDTGITTWVTLKRKYKHQGQQGFETHFKFCFANGRYYPVDAQPDYSPLIQIVDLPEDKPEPQPAMTQSRGTDFDKPDDFADIVDESNDEYDTNQLQI